MLKLRDYIENTLPPTQIRALKKELGSQTTYTRIMKGSMSATMRHLLIFAEYLEMTAYEFHEEYQLVDLSEREVQLLLDVHKVYSHSAEAA